MLIFLAAAASAPADNPKAFVERTYAQYRNHDFSPFDHLDRYFAPPMVAAIHEDERLAKGEVGYLDGDPICQCQDPEGLHAKVRRVAAMSPRKSMVEVILDWTESTPRRVRFTLVRTVAGWRIADVSSADEPSLLAALEKSNREQRAKQKRR